REQAKRSALFICGDVGGHSQPLLGSIYLDHVKVIKSAIMDKQKPMGDQESVWDYPRPPRVEPVDQSIRVVFNGVTIPESRRALRVLETSHPPVYYLPPDGVRMKYLLPTTRHTVCEFKGSATYWTIKVEDKLSPNAAWSYEQPWEGYEALQSHVAFYASRV